MRLAFFGSGEFGVPTLRSLASSHQLVTVITQPDRPAGRGRVLTPTPIAAATATIARSVPILKPENVNTPDMLELVRAVEADVWVVIAFGQKLSDGLLHNRFAINLHASLLPRWRGAAPINAAILAGDVETGNSVITLASRMDGGLILAQSRRPIDPSMTAGELHDLLAADGPALVMEVLRQHVSGGVKGTVQDERLVTRARKLSRRDAVIDFGTDADLIRRHIHGLTPWPGVDVIVSDGGEEHVLRLGRVETAPGRFPNRSAGTFADVAAGIVVCGNESGLIFREVQPPGGRGMTWNDFARGRRLSSNAAARGRSNATDI